MNETGWLVSGEGIVQKVQIIGATRTRVMIRAVHRTYLPERQEWLEPGKTALVPRETVRSRIPGACKVY